MKVEIWSDIVCPWCGLGHHRLKAAVQRFAYGEEVEVHHRSFQLHPDLPEGATQSVLEMLAVKIGVDESEIDASIASVEAIAEAEGLRPYLVRNNRVGNTALAHELLAYATAQGRHAEAWALLFKAYFGQARSIFDLGSLLDLAFEVGLDRDDARAALVSRRYRGSVDADIRRAQLLGATSVPFTIIDGRYGVPGGQGTDQLLQAIQGVWDKCHRSRHRDPLRSTGGASVCGPDGCAVSAERPSRI